MTTGYLGYVTAFDGITVHSGSTLKSLTAIGSTNTVQEKMFTLPNGTKVNYDGTTDTNVTPGSIKVDFWFTSSAYSTYDGLQAKKGNRGTLTKTKFSTVSPGTEICTAVLMNIDINQEKSRPKKGKLYVTMEFELETDWA